MTAKSSTALVDATGHDYDHWFDVLDARRGGEHTAGEARAWLREEHGISTWWAQKLVVEYEQIRGTRVPGTRPDGTVTIGVSRTVPAPAARAFTAVTNPDLHARWLPDVPLTPRTATPNRSARFDGPDGSRINIFVEATHEDRTTVTVEQQRLPMTVDHDEVKAAWTTRLHDLRALLAAQGEEIST